MTYADSLIQNNAASPSDTIDVMLDGISVVTKLLTSSWAPGNAGGLDAGVKVANGTYHVYLLEKTSDASLDALLSASATAPTVPTGYTVLRVLGAIMTDGSGVIRLFLQSDDFFRWIYPVTDYSGAANPAGPTLRTLTVPKGVKVIAQCFIDTFNTGNHGGYISIFDADLGPLDCVGVSNAVLLRLTGASEQGNTFIVRTSGAGKIYTGDNTSGSSYITIITQGWSDPRVRRHAI